MRSVVSDTASLMRRPAKRRTKIKVFKRCAINFAWLVAAESLRLSQAVSRLTHCSCVSGIVGEAGTFGILIFAAGFSRTHPRTKHKRKNARDPSSLLLV